MDRPTEEQIIARCHHVHPTPADIRASCADAIFAASREFEAKTGQHVPVQHMIDALDAGVKQACDEHLRRAS